MYEPELYNKSYKTVKSIVGQTIKRHFSKVPWRSDGVYHIFMDVGSGSGDVFNDYIHPLVAEKFHRFICSDISEKMLAFSEKTYGRQKGIEYRLFDVSTDLGVPPELRGEINHLTAINVLHMVEDLHRSVQNLYDFLRPHGGQCLMVLMPTNSSFQAFHQLSQSPKWQGYKEIIERYIPSLFYVQDPMADFEKLLMQTGFSKISIEKTTETYSYDSWQDFKDGLQSVCVVVEYLPTPTLRQEFLDEFVSKVVSLTRKSEADTKFYLQFDIIAASVQKN